MNLIRGVVMLFFIRAVSVVDGQTEPDKTTPTPIDTSVCKILANPSAFNNKLVKVRGYVRTTFEYSILVAEHCPDVGVWFVFADSSTPPELQVMVLR